MGGLAERRQHAATTVVGMRHGVTGVHAAQRAPAGDERKRCPSVVAHHSAINLGYPRCGGLSVLAPHLPAIEIDIEGPAVRFEKQTGNRRDVSLIRGSHAAGRDRHRSVPLILRSATSR